MGSWNVNWGSRFCAWRPYYAMDTQTQMLGALVRTYLTLLALFLTVRFMVFPMAVEWRQERKRAREARLRAEIQRAS